MPTDAPTAFFSYSRDDSEFALQLAGDLKAAGANVWLDQLDIQPGQRWARAVQDALNNSPRVLVILSPSAVDSTHVEDEGNFALEEHKTVIPVFYQDCKVPFQLRPFQYVDFRTDYGRGLKVMLKTLGVEQQATATAAAPSAASTVADADERQHAAGQTRLEVEHKQAAEQARLEEEREQAAKQAAERALLDQQERERLAEQARLEEEKRAGEQAAAKKARLEQEERERLQRESGTPTPTELQILPPVFKKIALAVCGILVVVFVLYWAMRPKPQEVVYQTPEANKTYNPPPSGEGTSNSATAEKAATDKAAADKAAAEQAANDKAAADKAAAKKATTKQQTTESLSGSAMREKGDNYYLGQGVPKDYKQALSWYRKAADAGNAQGMYYLGVMYKNGYGVEKDYQQAVSWYRKAAEAGNAWAMTNLGFMYQHGYGVKQDYQQAVTWYRKGAEAGDALGMANLGFMYQHGYGVQKDYQQALSWSRKGAEAGEPRGMTNLGLMYESGYGVEKDLQQAISWYRKAAQLGNEDAKTNLKRLGESP